MSPLTAALALRDATATLSAAGIEGAAGDARHLLAHAMGIGRDRLTLHLSDRITDEAAEMLALLVARRQAREPVARILGRRQFFGRGFEVTPDVLDPRPETECLVLAALDLPGARMLDLGTGSGAILLTLLAERPGATGTGTDISPAALAVAGRNADALGVAGRCELVQSDWFGEVKGAYDLILSNPPYIAADEMPGLSPEVRDHDPAFALSPGGDGLGAYRAIAAGLGAHLNPGGHVLVEIGPTQGKAVSALFSNSGLRAIAVLPDLDGRDRIVRATRF